MRILILQRILLAGLALLWVALFSLQVMHGAEYQKKAEKNRTRLVPLPASRGAIVDRHGIPLVENSVSFELAVFPQEIDDSSELWRKLQPIVKRSPEAMAKAYKRGFQGPFAPVPIISDLPSEIAFRIEEIKEELPGVMVRPVPRRRYLLGPAQGAVVGYVGMISQEELTRLKPYGYSFRDYIGKDGLELMYDEKLRGKAGGLMVEVNNRGKMVRQIGFRKPETGAKLTVTVDGRLQEFGYKLLSNKAGAVMVMDNATGEILCLVSAPSFDPNAFLDSSRSDEVRSYLRSADRPMFDRAISAAIAPGSTFKVAVAAHALQTGKVTKESSFDCPGGYQLGRRYFKCWLEKGHGMEDVVDALAHSCDVYFYHTGRRLKPEGIGQAARLFGFGTRTGIDLPGESNGFIPDPGWMKEVMKLPWQEGDTVSFAIGQSALTATPLQVMMLFAAFANDGKMPQPHLLMKVEEKPVPVRHHIRQVKLRPEVMARVKKGMEAVIGSDTGTGRLTDVPGLSIAGKTGTSQTTKGPTHAWIGGYVPSDHPKYSFVVFLEYGGHGGVEAALVARDMLAFMRELGYL